MAKYSRNKMDEFLNRSDGAGNSFEKGRALEDFICYIFEKVPGITVSKRNQMNTSSTEEIDIAFWNDKRQKGFHFLPYILLVECKNWSNTVGTSEVSYFINKVQNRGLTFGILIAANGITGSSNDISRAHHEISIALSRGIKIIVIELTEIMEFITTDDLIKLFKEKSCELAVSGTVF